MYILDKTYFYIKMIFIIILLLFISKIIYIYILIYKLFNYKNRYIYTLFYIIKNNL